MNRKQQIDRLNSMKDADIDYSDAPELPDVVWNKAERAKFFKPIKVQKNRAYRCRCAELARKRRAGLSNATQ